MSADRPELRGNSEVPQDPITPLTDRGSERFVTLLGLPPKSTLLSLGCVIAGGVTGWFVPVDLMFPGAPLLSETMILRETFAPMGAAIGIPVGIFLTEHINLFKKELNDYSRWLHEDFET